MTFRFFLQQLCKNFQGKFLILRSIESSHMTNRKCLSQLISLSYLSSYIFPEPICLQFSSIWKNPEFSSSIQPFSHLFPTGSRLRIRMIKEGSQKSVQFLISTTGTMSMCDPDPAAPQLCTCHIKKHCCTVPMGMHKIKLFPSDQFRQSEHISERMLFSYFYPFQPASKLLK